MSWTTAIQIFFQKFFNIFILWILRKKEDVILNQITLSLLIETEGTILHSYNMILQMEVIELHRLENIIIDNHGIP